MLYCLRIGQEKAKRSPVPDSSGAPFPGWGRHCRNWRLLMDVATSHPPFPDRGLSHQEAQSEAGRRGRTRTLSRHCGARHHYLGKGFSGPPRSGTSDREDTTRSTHRWIISRAVTPEAHPTTGGRRAAFKPSAPVENSRSRSSSKPVEFQGVLLVPSSRSKQQSPGASNTELSIA